MLLLKKQLASKKRARESTTQPTPAQEEEQQPPVIATSDSSEPAGKRIKLVNGLPSALFFTNVLAVSDSEDDEPDVVVEEAPRTVEKVDFDKIEQEFEEEMKREEAQKEAEPKETKSGGELPDGFFDNEPKQEVVLE